MLPFPFSIPLLGLLTIAVLFGLGQRVLDRMRLTDRGAIFILATMLLGHFLPTISLGTQLALNLGVLGPLLVAAYLLITTSKKERNRALIVSALTGILILLTDKLLPMEPGLLDPVISGGILAAPLAYLAGRSRRSAFIAGILGVLSADLLVSLQLWAQNIKSQQIIGSGGVFSSMILSPFLAVFLTELFGELREKLTTGGDLDE